MGQVEDIERLKTMIRTAEVDMNVNHANAGDGVNPEYERARDRYQRLKEKFKRQVSDDEHREFMGGEASEPNHIEDIREGCSNADNEELFVVYALAWLMPGDQMGRFGTDDVLKVVKSEAEQREMQDLREKLRQTNISGHDIGPLADSAEEIMVEW